MFSVCGMIPKDLLNKFELAKCEKEVLPTVSELLNSKDSLENNLNLISSILKLKNLQSIVKDNVYDDLELFKGNDSIENSVFNVINKTTTLFGNIHIKNILESPTKDISVLKERQNILNKINADMANKLKEKLDAIKELEEDVLWILRERNPEEIKLIDSVYFTNKYLTMLNTNEDIMSLYSLFTIFFAPIYGIVSPIVFFILPYIYLYFIAGIKFSFKAYFDIFKVSILGGFNIFSGGGKNNITKYFSVVLSIIIYFQNFMNTIKAAKNNHTIINVLHSKLHTLNKFMSTSQELFKIAKEIFKLDDIDIFNSELNNELFKSPPSLLTNKGKILVCYKTIGKIDIHIDKFKNYFNTIGLIDSYLSIVLLVNDFNEHNYNICYTRYNTNLTPTIKFKDIWHPYLANNNTSNTIISNCIEIGDKNPNNIVLTGPNAGGKSTFIKAISLSLLFSQTFGISFSNEAYITPMSLINTYLNIPDCKNKESLFEAEMHRARNHLKNLKDLGDHEFSFIVMDEIFSSTNPEEGISGAYAICNKLAQYKNSISVITTHFNYLTKLENTGEYKNYKIPIKRNQSNEIVYTYKLEEGASTQHIALELLKNKGFDEDIVDNAISVCDKLKHINNKNNEESANESKEANEEDGSANEEGDGSSNEESVNESKEDSANEDEEDGSVNEDEEDGSSNEESANESKEDSANEKSDGSANEKKETKYE